MFTLFNDTLPVTNPLPVHLLEGLKKLFPIRKSHKSVPFWFLRLPIADDEYFGGGRVGIFEGSEEEGFGYFGSQVTDEETPMGCVEVVIGGWSSLDMFWFCLTGD